MTQNHSLTRISPDAYEIFRFQGVVPGDPLIAYALVRGYIDYNRGQGKKFPFLPIQPTEEIINVTNLAGLSEKGHK